MSTQSLIQEWSRRVFWYAAWRHYANGLYLLNHFTSKNSTLLAEHNNRLVWWSIRLTVTQLTPVWEIIWYHWRKLDNISKSFRNFVIAFTISILLFLFFFEYFYYKKKIEEQMHYPPQFFSLNYWTNFDNCLNSPAYELDRGGPCLREWVQGFDQQVWNENED